jgi:hypothetical protein
MPEYRLIRVITEKVLDADAFTGLYGVVNLVSMQMDGLKG